jgi:hypothetical protein
VPAWKLLFVVMKARRGWKRIPPERRRKLIEGAGKQVRTRGPVVAKRIGTTLKQVRRAR